MLYIVREGNVPLRLDNGMSVQIAVLASVEPNSCNGGCLRCGVVRVLVPFTCVSFSRICLALLRERTGQLDKLAAVLRDAKADTLQCHIVVGCERRVSRGGYGSTIACVVKVLEELATLLAVSLLLSLEPSLLNSFGACLALLLKHIGVDELKMAVALCHP